MAGIDEYLLGTLVAGGDGLMGSTPNFLPKLSVDLYQAFLNLVTAFYFFFVTQLSGFGKILFCLSKKMSLVGGVRSST